MAERPTVRNFITGNVYGSAVQIGVLNGDIVYERPAYRLQQLVPADQQVVPRSRRGPSYLLDARRQVVPFLARPAEFARLCDWGNATDHRVSMLLVHGAGGQGKTRLVSEFASTAPQGWMVAEATETSVMAPLHTAPARPRVADGIGSLVIIDYADRWNMETLRDLICDLSRPAWSGSTSPVRLLLLARQDTDLWKRLTSELDRWDIEFASPLELAEFTTDRRAAFDAAASAFAAALGFAQQQLPPPSNLDADAYSGPLDLHMAALAAVVANHDGTATPDHDDLSGYLLNHERRCWGDDVDDTIEQVVFVSTLFGPLTNRGAARDLLKRAILADDGTDANKIIDQHRRLYPQPAEQVDIDVLTPLRPDRFGEDFIADCLTRPAGRDRLRDLLTAEATSEPVTLRRCLTVLAASAARNTSAREALLAVLKREPGLARHAPAPAVDVVADIADYPTASAVFRELPEFSTELLTSAARLAQRVVERMPSELADVARAEHLLQLGRRLRDAGRAEEALAPVQDVVRIQRHLAADGSDRHHFDLAWALGALSGTLTDMWRLTEALRHAEEAIRIYRSVAPPAESGQVLPALVSELQQLSVCLAKQRRHKTALTVAEEAVQTYRDLIAAYPREFQTSLADSLTSLSNRLSEMGRHKDAVAPAREAVLTYRQLTEANVERYLPGLAGTLHNLALRLSETSVGEAIEVGTQAVDLYRRLAEDNPHTFLPRLADALSGLDTSLSVAGRWKEGIPFIEEAVRIYLGLVADGPQDHLPSLATHLHNLGKSLDQAGRVQEALTATMGSVKIRSRLAAGNGEAFRADLADSLWTFAAVRAKAHTELEDAMSAIDNAIDIYTNLKKDLPAVYRSRYWGARATRSDVRAAQKRAQAGR